MRRMIAVAMLATACGVPEEQPVDIPDAGEQQMDASQVEPVTVEVTRALGYAPALGGATYEIEIGARASRDAWCRIDIACDERLLHEDTSIGVPASGTVVRFYLYDGVPACESRTVEIRCPGGSVQSIWSAGVEPRD